MGAVSEGTICPISWVKETLFPYALNALPDVLATKWDDEKFKTYRDGFPESARSSPGLFEEHVKDLTARDVKVAYLKDLQGYLWEDGYRSHAYSTPVYIDVLAWMDGLALSSATTDAQNTAVAIAIYSSGSTFAQKLLFQHIKDPAKPEDPTAVFDRRDIITAWFDTTNAGPKNESSSYTKIASELQRKPEEILFLSDNVKEVRAAIGAKFHAVVVDRPGNAPLSDADREEFQVVESFEQLDLR
ncbi:2,3-diketo-5-methylthio-1-phosphopentane phosphatase, variant [Phialophora macrospora]|uniref:2,3-diketo-5-methylthio-1-phosphopentane phosphatase, variant n=1 Tax=Phialophora macrospora TaxID=1851006 RepID=A0A0D2EC42_9EURO|nr:2,3-diketo-5-methylthio-1-phosphopentane phosphatase, variant [Phialophora macrospora]